MGCAVWLDDVRPMPKDFDVHLRTADDAIEAIKTGLVEIISLDADLGIGCTPGTAVAKFIEEGARIGRIQRLAVYVHTMCDQARIEMLRCIANADKYWRTYDLQTGAPAQDVGDQEGQTETTQAGKA